MIWFDDECINNTKHACPGLLCPIAAMSQALRRPPAPASAPVCLAHRLARVILMTGRCVSFESFNHSKRLMINDIFLSIFQIISNDMFCFQLSCHAWGSPSCIVWFLCRPASNVRRMSAVAFPSTDPIPGLLKQFCYFTIDRMTSKQRKK